MKVSQFTDIAKVTEESVFTPEELARKVRLHPTTIRKLFLEEEGVIRIGHPGTGRRRQYFTLRIPQSVVERVFSRMTVSANRAK